jgi:excinuclease ABC subunit A
LDNIKHSLAYSLSGGEKQRIYLLSKLQKNLSNSFLLFENLSFGLSEKELVKTAEFLQSLLDQNNTIVIIDQHPLFQSIAAYHYKME